MPLQQGISGEGRAVCMEDVRLTTSDSFSWKAHTQGLRQTQEDAILTAHLLRGTEICSPLPSSDRSQLCWQNGGFLRGTSFWLAACLKLPFPATWGCCEVRPCPTCFSILLWESLWGKKDGWTQVPTKLGSLFNREKAMLSLSSGVWGHTISLLS